MSKVVDWKIYVHVSPEGKAYVGRTSRSINERCGRGSPYYRNKAFYSDIQKFGWDAFEHKIVADGLTYDEACEKEIETIREYDSLVPNGYNRSVGGAVPSTGCHRTDEMKAHCSEMIKQKWNNEDYRSRVTNTIKLLGIRPPSRLGVPNPNKKAVNQYTLDGDFVASYPSVHAAAEALHVTVMCISNACNGKTKTSQGYRFAFAGGEA